MRPHRKAARWCGFGTTLTSPDSSAGRWPACDIMSSHRVRVGATSRLSKLDSQEVEKAEQGTGGQAPDGAGHVPVFFIGQMRVDEDSDQDLTLQAGHTDLSAVRHKAVWCR